MAATSAAPNPHPQVAIVDLERRSCRMNDQPEGRAQRDDHTRNPAIIFK